MYPTSFIAPLSPPPHPTLMLILRVPGKLSWTLPRWTERNTGRYNSQSADQLNIQGAKRYKVKLHICKRLGLRIAKSPFGGNKTAEQTEDRAD